MGTYHAFAALRQYQANSAAGAAVDASPWKLVEMLYSGLLERLTMARGCMQRGDVLGKLRLISAAVGIVDHLRVCLDPKAGQQIAAMLDELYDYMVRRLVQANIQTDPGILDEVIDLVRTLKTGWDGMPGPRQ